MLSRLYYDLHLNTSPSSFLHYTASFSNSYCPRIFCLTCIVETHSIICRMSSGYRISPYDLSSFSSDVLLVRNRNHCPIIWRLIKSPTLSESSSNGSQGCRVFLSVLQSPDHPRARCGCETVGRPLPGHLSRTLFPCSSGRRTCFAQFERNGFEIV